MEQFEDLLTVVVVSVSVRGEAESNTRLLCFAPPEGKAGAQLIFSARWTWKSCREAAQCHQYPACRSHLCLPAHAPRMQA
jgi:hypothetical protein